MVKRWWIIAWIIVAVFAVAIVISMSYSSKTQSPINSTGDNPVNLGDMNQVECNSNSDCVSDACCHPKGCVGKENAPTCKSVLCTMNCEPGTLDCGQGSCTCENNLCVAKFNK